MNWSAKRFKHELQFFHFYTPPNYISIMQNFETALCPEPGNARQIDEYYGAFSTALQNIRVYGLTSRYGKESISQRFYNELPALLKQYMAYDRSTNTLRISSMTIMRCRKMSGTFNNGDRLLMHSRN